MKGQHNGRQKITGKAHQKTAREDTANHTGLDNIGFAPSDGGDSHLGAMLAIKWHMARTETRTTYDHLNSIAKRRIDQPTDGLADTFSQFFRRK